MNLAGLELGLAHVFEWVVRTSIEASILVLLVLLIQHLYGRRLPVQTRFALSCLVLLRLLLPAVPSSSFSLFNWVVRPRAAVKMRLPAPAIPPSIAVEPFSPASVTT